jgi:hypothetical protein
MLHLVSPSPRGVDLQRSPATIRLLATEIFSDNVQMLGHRTFSEQKDRHSLSFLVHAGCPVMFGIVGLQNLSQYSSAFVGAQISLSAAQ